jgi:predicted ArsR family transcriptional regulator
MSETVPTPRRPPTAAEARALAHPTRLRILFACREHARTNKELAEQLGTTPGTIHYHLRPLVAEGFLRAETPRPGPRGSREQPYRATGKSWEIGGTADTGRALRQVGAEELLATEDDDVVSLARLGVSLPQDELTAVLERIHAVLEEAKARTHELATSGGDGSTTAADEPVTLLFAAHRSGR